MNAKELLKLVPKSYREVNYKTYLNLINNVLVGNEYGMEDDEFRYYQSISTLAILLDVTYSELEQLPFTTIKPLLDSLSFLNHDIPITYTSIQVKEIEALTYNEFQFLIKAIPDQFNNMPEILETVIEGMSKKEIDELSIWEVMQIMGKLLNCYKQSINRSQKSLGWSLMKRMLKEKVSKIFKVG